MKKVGIGFILSTALLFSGLSVSAAGTGDNPVDVPIVVTKEDQKKYEIKERTLQDYIKEQKKQSKTKTGDFSAQVLPDGKYKTIGVPSFKQETNYWCGPATTKQVLHFLNGSSSSQSYYAGQLGTTSQGTTFPYVADVLNKFQSKNTYYYKSIVDYSTWSWRVQYNTDNNYPTVLDLEIYPSYMPKYTTHIEGHILNVSGYDTRYSPLQIRLTDPFDQGNRGVTLGNVWHPHKGVFDANWAHSRQSMIW